MELIKCMPEHFEPVTEFYERVVKHLQETVNYPKWSKEHPNREGIRASIAKGEQYICMDGAEIVGAVVLNEDPGGNYDAGEWSRELKSGEYMVVHTFATEPSGRHKGIGSAMLDACIELVRRAGYKAIRLDVVPGNIPAINLYKKKHFTYAGTKDLERGFDYIPEFELYELNFEEKQERKENQFKKAFKAAFPHTIPIFAGFWFLGMTYGIYMNASGFSFWYPMLMSLTIFAGSMEFLTVNFLMGAFNPLQVFMMTLMINARHLFYGISMLDKYKGTGWKKFYLIFGMCDESFSINYTAEIPEDVDKGSFMFSVTLLNHFYWVFGATLGGIFGSLIHFSTEGLDFVMTALFVVIFMEQWLKDKNHTSELVGLGLSLLCLIVFGADNFILPAMLAILVVLSLLRNKKGGEVQ